MILPQIILPWPAPPLWNNTRKHRLAVAPIRKAQRSDAYAIACEAGWHRAEAIGGVVAMQWTFCPPDRRRYDISNALGAMKSAGGGR